MKRQERTLFLESETYRGIKSGKVTFDEVGSAEGDLRKVHG